MKCIPKDKRNFLCCADCKFFEFTEWVDESLGISNGNCTQFDKKVANHWESNCELHSELHCCEECAYFSDIFDWCEDPDYESDDTEEFVTTWCSAMGSDPCENDPCCAGFKLKE